MKRKLFILSVAFALFHAILTGQVYSNYTIYTPKGTAVTARKLVSGELTNSKKEEWKDFWLNYYDNRITYAGEATHSYNCHAYAWYVSEGNSYVWITSPGDDAFWNDNSYVLTNSPSQDCKVSFTLDDHSAITTSQNGYLKSKWGSAPLFIHSINDCPYTSTSLKYYTYPDPNYNTVADKPSVVTFNMTGNGEFSASVTNDSRYNVDLYEWKADYSDDWYVYAQNTGKSSVKVYGSSTPRSCYLSARAHNSYGWGAWQTIGWLYVSQSYSLTIAQNPVKTTLSVQIEPVSEVQVIRKDLTDIATEKSDTDLFVVDESNKSIAFENQAYSVSLYSYTGTCVYQSTTNNNGNNIINLNINVSALPNGTYFLQVRNIKANEMPQTLKVIVKH